MTAYTPEVKTPRGHLSHVTCPPLKTPFGTLEMVLTEADHVSIATPNDHSIVIRKIPYYVHAHFYKWKDGTWNRKPSPEAKEWEHRTYMTRRDAGHMYEEASEAAKASMDDAINRSLSMLSPEEFAPLRHRAEMNKLNNKIMSVCEEIGEAEKVLQEAKDRRDALVEREHFLTVRPQAIDDGANKAF